MNEINYLQNAFIITITMLLLTFIDWLWIVKIANDKYAKVFKKNTATNKIYRILLFYFIFSIGLVVFAIEPSINHNSLGIAMFRGAAFGFLVYALHGLMNWITITKWQVKVMVQSVFWGALLSWSVATIVYNIYTAF